MYYCKIRKFFVFSILLIIFSFMFTNLGFCKIREKAKVNGQSVILSASSFCKDYGNIKFNVSQVFNGNPNRPWMAADKFKSSQGEWVKINFIKPVKVVALRISPGFTRNRERYCKYSRIKKFKVILGEGHKLISQTYTRYFDNDPRKDIVILFSTQPVIRNIKIKILDIYSGTESKNALIGEIEPIIIKNGKVISHKDSRVIRGIIQFLKMTHNSIKAFSFVYPYGNITISKSVKFTNPIDSIAGRSFSRLYSKKQLRNKFNMWEDLCWNIYNDYRFNSQSRLNYFWRASKKDRFVFYMPASSNFDVLNSYKLGLLFQKTSKIITQKNNKKKKKVVFYKTWINSIKMSQDVHTP